MVETFNCPSCRAPLEFPSDNSILVQCQYCHNVVAVPMASQSLPVTLETQSAVPVVSNPGLVEQKSPERSDLMGEIARLTRSGDQVGAIRLYRMATGAGIKDSKLAIDQFVATGRLELRRTHVSPQQTMGEIIQALGGDRVAPGQIPPPLIPPPQRPVSNTIPDRDARRKSRTAVFAMLLLSFLLCMMGIFVYFLANM